MNSTNYPLSELQAWMQHALIHSGTHTANDDIIAHIAPSAALTAPQRLSIYQRGYYARLIQCMEGQFKALCHALGKDLFDDFAREYLTTYPSQSTTLAELGARFPAHIAETRPDKDAVEKEEWIDFMVDLARFEWDLYTMFDIPGNEGNPYADESHTDDRLQLQPCFSLHNYGFPVGNYYNEVAKGNEPGIPTQVQTFLAITRKDYRTGIFTLLPAQYFFLREIAGGINIESALLNTAEHFKTTIEVVHEAWGNWRREWLENGFFVAK